MYHASVIRRLYINNFRCLENFELRISDQPSVLLIGKNGAGKSTVAFALQILQKIARGTNRVGELAKPKDFARGRVDSPMRFQIEVDLDSRVFEYTIAFELPERFKELRIFEERLAVAGKSLYSREISQVHLARSGMENAAQFSIDWHLAALPVIQQQPGDPLSIFRQWLARALILRPIPYLITGDSRDETLFPDESVTDFGAWFSGLLAEAPSAYTKIDEYLRQVMPDLKAIRNPETGTESRSIVLQFLSERKNLDISFKDLSDGEKCFLICALVLAANDTYGPLLCFWDEPDGHLALSEVGHFIMALRKGFQNGGQLITTSHNDEAIRRFSAENTLILERKNHLEPTTVRSLAEIPISGDLIGALVRDDLAS